MVLVVLAVSTVLVVLQVVDPNDYKPQISALVEEKTGRRLDLAGDLQLTFFPWVGIETGPLSLSNAEGFGDVPMISADNARIRVKLLPLIKRRVEAGTVVLDAPVVHLLTAVDGRTNWDDLAGMGMNTARKGRKGSPRRSRDWRCRGCRSRTGGLSGMTQLPATSWSCRISTCPRACWCRVNRWMSPCPWMRRVPPCRGGHTWKWRPPSH